MSKFGTKMPYLGIFGLEFLESIAIFEISTLKFVISESLTHIVNFGIGSTFLKVQGPLFLKVCVLIHFVKYAGNLCR